MSLTDSTREQIESIINDHRVVLFMKGTPQAPMCGFSSKTIGLLDTILDDYNSFDVLSDQDIREGIKEYGNWPTIPQLYIEGELVGGCDIVTAMFNNGELHEMLGVKSPDRTPPEVSITDKAVAVCPVGAILPKHKGYEKPIGERLYDNKPISIMGDVAANFSLNSFNKDVDVK